MVGNSELYAALNVTAITNLLSTYGSGKALINDVILPETLTATSTSILYYPNGIFSGALDYGRYQFSVNCRAPSYSGSRTLAETVQTEINRVSYSDYYIVASVLQTIPPQDSTDNYNTPVSVILKTRN